MRRRHGLVDAAFQVHRVHAGGTCFMPSCTIDCASTVAVVVPSPATSEVLNDFLHHLCPDRTPQLGFLRPTRRLS